MILNAAPINSKSINSNTGNKNKLISIWLAAVCIAIILMIFIGGLTRLTNSGLSITEWKPISGIIPPLSNEKWELEFDKYKLSPEYMKINKGMSLDQFKSIFWIEFIHRALGRVTGIIFLIPFLYFLIVKFEFSRAEISIYSLSLILLAAQGFAGWYMVKSGLISDPHVSHFRLAMHLFLAVTLYAILFWQFLKNFISLPASINLETKSLAEQKYKKNTAKVKIWLNISLTLLLIQIVLGAFVAGLDAGLVYNSFPMMGETIIPYEVTNDNISIKSFSDPVFIQFLHRVFGCLLLVTIFISYHAGYKLQNPLTTMALKYLIITIILQITAGIITLIYVVPIIIALIHQMGAIILLSVLLWAKYTANHALES